MATGAVDLSITIGGDAGQGVESSGAGFSKALARGGLYVFSIADYRSRIRGGHNFYQIRASDREVFSHQDPVHLLIALTRESVEIHMEHVAEGGGVLYDDGFPANAADLVASRLRPLPCPLVKFAERYGSRIMVNTAAVAAAAAVIGYPFHYVEQVIRENFAPKGATVVQGNLDTARAAYEYAADRYGPDFPFKLPAFEGAPPRMLLNGNDALCLGAALAGCRFLAQYPMTPATTILEWMVNRGEPLGIVAKHAEDEIAAICMAIGAAYAGARSMVATSGGGFSLMAEALGMAGMTEIPLVVVEVQRGGPSTGLPTRTEQGDLLFLLHASQGEFPRILLAPGTVEECFEAGWRAFNLAERYQTPVLVVSDQFLAGSLRTVPPDRFPYQPGIIDRGKLLADDALRAGANDRFRRYAFTEDGISPRSVPGQPGGVHAVSTDEHDEEGHITEEIENRRRMMAKRMRKLETARAEMRPPRWYGPAGADITLITWGSTYGPAREAVDELNRQGLPANLLHFSDLWPLPVPAVEQALARIRRGVVVEQNFTGQLARLLRMETGAVFPHHLRKYDGRPFSPREIVNMVREEVNVVARNGHAERTFLQ